MDSLHDIKVSVIRLVMGYYVYLGHPFNQMSFSVFTLHFLLDVSLFRLITQ